MMMMMIDETDVKDRQCKKHKRQNVKPANVANWKKWAKKW